MTLKNALSFNSKALASYPFYLKALIAFCAGALMVPAMAPWHIWPLLFVGYSLFFILLCKAGSIKTAAFYGFLFGFGFHLFGLSWIGNALLVEGNDYQWAWPLAVTGLPLLLGLFSAGAALLSYPFMKSKKEAATSFRGLIAFILFLSLFEWIRGHIFTGFPWNLAGYTWGNILPIAQLAALGGIYFLTMVTIFWAAIPGFLFAEQRGRKATIGLLIFGLLSIGATYGFGTMRLAQHPTETNTDIILKLVQPNIAQSDKWNPEKIGENLGALLELSSFLPAHKGKTTLIIWPETALPYYLLRHENVQNAIRNTLETYGQNPVYLLSGVLRHETTQESEQQENQTSERYYNSLVTYDSALNTVAVYDKSHLVPFGEYIPFKKFIPIPAVTGFEGFVQGTGAKTLNVMGIPPFSALVCYEVIFPGAAIAHKNKPQWIVNVTNDGWYGKSAGPRQHFVQAQFRAIEEGLPLIRVANTGISGIIDPTGRIITRTKLLEVASPSGFLPAPLKKGTFYSHFRESIFSSFILIFLIFLIGSFIKDKKTHSKA